MQGKTAKEQAKWRANTMRAKSNEYVCTVAGFTTAGGALWWPGKLVPVYDYWWEVNADLFLKEVEFSKDHSKGAITQLKFSLEDSFKSQAGRGSAAGRTGSSGLPGDPGEIHRKVSPSEAGIDDETEVDVDG
jgi:prophage tail gpP-like protein